MNLTLSATSRRALKLLKAAALMTASVLVHLLHFVLVPARASSGSSLGSSSNGGDDG